VEEHVAPVCGSIDRHHRLDLHLAGEVDEDEAIEATVVPGMEHALAPAGAHPVRPRLEPHHQVQPVGGDRLVVQSSGRPRDLARRPPERGAHLHHVEGRAGLEAAL